jgi:arginyl-tRNA synthetase
MMAMCAAFGDTPGEHLEIMIGQMVSLMRDGEPLRMSKRAGTVVAMEDLVEAVGVDAARYALARSSINQTLDIDLEQLSRRTNDNPVFYVQYAHARTRQIVKNAELAGVTTEIFDPSLLSNESESILIAKLAEFPRVLASAAEFREPHRVARYLEDVAGSFHRWYDACRVIPLAGDSVTDLHHSRLALNLAVSVVLRNGLGLLGVTAPERM